MTGRPSYTDTLGVVPTRTLAASMWNPYAPPGYPRVPPPGMPPGYPPMGYPPMMMGMPPRPMMGMPRPMPPGAPRPGMAPMRPMPPAGTPPPAVAPALGSQPPAERICTVYVGKIPEALADELLSQMLECCGKVSMWKRSTDPESGKQKGFGFCDFSTGEGALRAMRLLPKTQVTHCHTGGRLWG